MKDKTNNDLSSHFSKQCYQLFEMNIDILISISSVSQVESTQVEPGSNLHIEIADHRHLLRLQAQYGLETVNTKTILFVLLKRVSQCQQGVVDILTVVERRLFCLILLLYGLNLIRSIDLRHLRLMSIE